MNRPVSQRNSDIILSYKTPKSLRQVGREFGITHQRVRQIILANAPDAIRSRSDWIKTTPRKKLSIQEKRKNIYTSIWPKDEVDFLIEKYPNTSASKIGVAIGKNTNQVIGKANRLIKLGLLEAKQ